MQEQETPALVQAPVAKKRKAEVEPSTSPRETRPQKKQEQEKSEEQDTTPTKKKDEEKTKKEEQAKKSTDKKKAVQMEEEEQPVEELHPRKKVLVKRAKPQEMPTPPSSIHLSREKQVIRERALTWNVQGAKEEIKGIINVLG